MLWKRISGYTIKAELKTGFSQLIRGSIWWFDSWRLSGSIWMSEARYLCTDDHYFLKDSTWIKVEACRHDKLYMSPWIVPRNHICGFLCDHNTGGVEICWRNFRPMEASTTSRWPIPFTVKVKSQKFDMESIPCVQSIAI